MLGGLIHEYADDRGRTRSRQALEEQRRPYETLIEVSRIAIITGDPDLIVTSWNPGGERLFCYSKEEAIGRHINDLVTLSDDGRDEALALDWKLFEEPIRLVGRRTRTPSSQPKPTT